jgi:2-polyprenyl-3-methyl-5-hydroxy-6-metoxy-1,4-benzoquinol methylase
MESMQTPTDQIQKEYDVLYLRDPLRWDGTERDSYALDLINLYRWATKRGVPKAMLDVGCGSGHTIECFSHSWPQTEMQGLDLSEVAIGLARKRIPKGLFRVGFLENVALAEQFDLITLMGVLEHFPEPILALTRIRDLLSPGGMVYVEVPNCISYPGTDRVEGFRLSNSASRQGEWHLFRKSWEEIIQSSGLCINLAVTGPRRTVEFVWILTHQNENLPYHRRVRAHAYEKLTAARAHLPTIPYMYRLSNMITKGCLYLVKSGPSRVAV